MVNNFNEKANFIWSVADLLRGPYRPNQYKDVMLPMTVLRRLDCVLEPTKEKVLEEFERRKNGSIKNLDPVLNRVSGQSFHNTSKFTFEKLTGDANNIAANLTNYIGGFSAQAREILSHFKFEEHIAKLDKADRLYLLVKKFGEVDLHPDVVSNITMGYIFEDLIRRFNEASNEEAGDHFTPREVIKLMVNLLFLPDKDILTKKGIVKTLYDPACGTGGMLSVSELYVRELNRDAQLEVFGQDYNDQAFAVCGSDMMIKGENIEHIQFGDSFTKDQFPSHKFDYMLANPPFGVEWKPEETVIRKEQEEQGFGGRFGAGLPRINDGALLFLQHMISKMKPVSEGGTRLGIVFNGSPLFTGGAGSGESEIRRWIIENDWLEAIVALPDQLFYNTGISTFVWIVTNRKERHRKGKIQLVNGVNFFSKLRKSLGQKRNEIDESHIEDITRLYGAFEENEYVQIFSNDEFAYNRVTVEHPLRVKFEITEDGLNDLSEHSAFVGLASSKKRKDVETAEREIAAGIAEQAKILKALRGLIGLEATDNHEVFSKRVLSELKKQGVTTSNSLNNAIWECFSKRDETANVWKDSKGKVLADPDMRDYENVPFKEEIDSYIAREVTPFAPDAWVDLTKTKVGYEINFNKYFYRYVEPRSVEDIETELKSVEDEIAGLLAEVSA